MNLIISICTEVKIFVEKNHPKNQKVIPDLSKFEMKP